MMTFTFEGIRSNCHTKEREESVHWKDVLGAESHGWAESRMRERQAWGHLFGEGEDKARGNSSYYRLALSLSSLFTQGSL